MKKHYFVKYPRNFNNEYELGWSYEKALEGWEAITRQEAVALARREIERRKENPAFSGCADSYIYPIPGGTTPILDEYNLQRLADGFPVDGWQVVDRIIYPE